MISCASAINFNEGRIFLWSNAERNKIDGFGRVVGGAALHTSKMFSKNFYEIDEVVASLVASLFRQAPIETLFWAKELIDSFATSYLIESLVLVYTLKFGANRLEYINVLSGIVLRKTWSEHDLMRVTYLLTLIDSSYKSYAVLGYLADGQNDDVAEVSREWLGRPSHPFDVAMHYLMEVVEASEESLAPMELPKLPSVLRVIFNETGRKRRFFSVTASYLYGMCQRGFMIISENTEEKLLTAHKTYNRSNCWKYMPGPENAYSVDDKVVEKWETCMRIVFPDDIPDEWSKEERMKSHGSGALKENEVVILNEWISKMLGINCDKFNDKLVFPDIAILRLFDIKKI
jgi:hypothetical protein